MEERKAKLSGRKQGKAGRRIAWLAVFILFAGVAYTAGWYWFAAQIDAAAARAIEQQKQAGIDIACTDRDVSGYPFRFEVRCSSLEIAQPAEAVSASAGAFRSAAQVYQPRKIVAELDGPVTVEAAGLPPIELNWRLAQASADIADPLPLRASIAIDSLQAAFGEIERAVEAMHYEGHMRRVVGDLDLAARFEGLVISPDLTDGRELPPLGGDYDLRVNDGVALVANGANTLRNVSGELRNAIMRVTPNQGVEATGTFSVGDDGLLDAELQVTFVDAAGLAQALKPAFPEYASQIDMLAAAQPASTGDGPPEFVLPVTIRDGQAKLGFITLGQIPPLN